MDAPPEPPGSIEAAAVAPPTPPTVLPSGDGPEQLTKTPPAPDSTEGPQTTPESNGKGKAAKKSRGSSGKKKTLEEIKRQGRQTRAAQKGTDFTDYMADLTIDSKLKAPPGTGLIYDASMADHFCTWDPGYPECPARLTRSYERCVHYGLVDRCVQLQSQHAKEEDPLLQHTPQHVDLISSLPGRGEDRHKLFANTHDSVYINDPKPATEKDALIQHSQTYVAKQQESSTSTVEQLKELSAKYDGMFYNNSTYDCSMMALGCTKELVTQVVQGNVRNGMAIVRPPGHHAMREEACGYCFFNNVAIAAKYALDELGLKRILIVDWDVHHGQGTQYMFYDDPRVIYFSIHRYEHGEFWPNLRESDYDHIGEGGGKGYNINIPLNKTGMTNSDYLAIFQQVLLPIAYEYSPELVLVSAGYDAAIGCPEFSPELVIVSAGFDSAIGDEKGEMEVTPAGYAHLTHLLSSLAGGKLCVILEGGYCLQSLQEGVALTLRSLLGDPCPLIGPQQPPCDSIVETILNSINVLRPHWRSLQFQGVAEQSNEVSSTTKEKSDIQFSTPENRPESFPICGDFPTQSPDVIAEFERRINKLIAETDLTKPRNRTSLVYDVGMTKHKYHANSMHPERPDRVSRIFAKHREYGLLTRCLKLPSRSATEEELQLLHGNKYIARVKAFQETKPRDLYKMQFDYNSIYLTQEVWECSRLATGCVLNLVDEVLTGQSENGVGIVRPPGHHAEAHTAMGFCYFNTIALAAKYAQKKYGLQRVLILDWDVHHGNGTQHMFDEDPSVMYMSLHRYDHGFFFPNSEDADFDQVGKGAGEGYNVNIAWNKHGMGDAEYIAAFQQVIMPIAYEYDPQLVLISAGFDAAKGDPLGGCRITPEGYAQMTHMLKGLANGKVIMALEGGYNLFSIEESMTMCTYILLGGVCPQLPALVPNSSAVESINNTLSVHQHYWKTLKPFRASLASPLTEVSRVQDIVCSSPDSSISSCSSDHGLDDLESRLKNISVSDRPTSAPASVSSSTQQQQPCSTAPTNMESKPENITSTSSMETTESQPEVSTSELGATVDLAPEDGAELGACGGSTVVPSSGPSVAEFLGPAVAQDLDSLEMFAVVPLPWCPHLSSVQPLPAGGLDTSAPCLDCGNVGENWVCLVCYQVHCSRFVNEHMLMHGLSTEHRVVLSYADLSVWCYGCDSYVHNQVLGPAKQSAHVSKFGEDYPGA